MRALLDENLPLRLKRALADAGEIHTVQDAGWSALQNGDLLDQAEADDYEAFITTDQNLKSQQNLTTRSIRILVLTTTSWPRIGKKLHKVRDALKSLDEGGYMEVNI